MDERIDIFQLMVDASKKIPDLNSGKWMMRVAPRHVIEERLEQAGFSQLEIDAIIKKGCETLGISELGL